MTPSPATIIGRGPTRILLALLVVYHRDGRATVRTVAAQAHRALSVTYYHLLVLRYEGLVAWEGGRGNARSGSLRPLVGRVAR